MNYCVKMGLTIYPSCQSNGKIKLFVGQGERFKPLNDNIYMQSTEEDSLEYTIAIIKGYSEYAKKIKLKIKNGEKNN